MLKSHFCITDILTVHVENSLPLLAQDIPSPLVLDVMVTNIGTERIEACDSPCSPLQLMVALSADQYWTDGVDVPLDLDGLSMGKPCIL